MGSETLPYFRLRVFPIPRLDGNLDFEFLEGTDSSYFLDFESFGVADSSYFQTSNLWGIQTLRNFNTPSLSDLETREDS